MASLKDSYEDEVYSDDDKIVHINDDILYVNSYNIDSKNGSRNNGSDCDNIDSGVRDSRKSSQKESGKDVELYCDANVYKSLSSPSAMVMKGMNLDLSLAEPKEEYNDESCSRVQEEAVNVVFDLPDGSQGENIFKMGHTVQVLKSFVETEYGIPMAEQQLFLEERILHDPFSLLDYSEAKGVDEVFVRVEGVIPESHRK